VDRLTRDQILEAFVALARALDPSSGPHELIVMGGAAVVLLYQARDATKDVDVVGSDPAVRAAARGIAAGLGLPEDWLNDAAKGYVRGLSIGPAVFEAPTLRVVTLGLHQLLAMKLCAWRDDVDIEDARLLLSRQPGGRDELWRRLEPHLVPGRELKARYAFDDLWEALYGHS
jgi:hypothetical protein